MNDPSRIRSFFKGVWSFYVEIEEIERIHDYTDRNKTGSSVGLYVIAKKGAAIATLALAWPLSSLSVILYLGIVTSNCKNIRSVE
ncbi:hypothetical protein Avbf_09213 [Armadillidium vulgare]|nr:hypothetical protein Avbf_09213 [Armadillidium vulgare]